MGNCFKKKIIKNNEKILNSKISKKENSKYLSSKNFLIQKQKTISNNKIKIQELHYNIEDLIISNIDNTIYKDFDDYNKNKNKIEINNIEDTELISFQNNIKYMEFINIKNNYYFFNNLNKKNNKKTLKKRLDYELLNKMIVKKEVEYKIEKEFKIIKFES